MFFANLTRGLAPEQCPDNDNHNVDTIDGLIMPVPVILAGCQGSLEEMQQSAAGCAAVTRASSALPGYVGRYATSSVMS